MGCFPGILASQKGETSKLVEKLSCPKGHEIVPSELVRTTDENYNQGMWCDVCDRNYLLDELQVRYEH